MVTIMDVLNLNLVIIIVHEKWFWEITMYLNSLFLKIFYKLVILLLLIYLLISSMVSWNKCCLKYWIYILYTSWPGKRYFAIL